jgi:hypothetical protein
MLILAYGDTIRASFDVGVGTPPGAIPAIGFNALGTQLLTVWNSLSVMLVVSFAHTQAIRLPWPQLLVGEHIESIHAPTTTLQDSITS